jgi:hypothetical protein
LAYTLKEDDDDDDDDDNDDDNDDDDDDLLDKLWRQIPLRDSGFKKLQLDHESVN